MVVVAGCFSVMPSSFPGDDADKQTVRHRPVEHEGGDHSLYFEDPVGSPVEAWDLVESGDCARKGVAATAESRPRAKELILLCVWRDPDLNRGHHDFQSCALPAELSRRSGRS